MTSPNLIWNTVFGLKSHRQLPTALFNLAAECARRAIEEPNQGPVTGLDKLIRLMSIGQAAELVVKSTLAGIDPTLLADKANTVTLYALAGNTRKLQGKVTTLGPVEAVRRLNECRPLTSPHVAEPKSLFDVRNDAIHMGLAPNDADLEEALTELVTLVDNVFKVREALRQGHDLRAFWSPKHIQIVQARQRARYERLLKNFQGLIKQAQANYARLTAGLTPDARNRLIAELVARTPDVDYEQTLRPHKCPACQNSLWVVYDVQRDIEVDDSDAPHSFGLFAKVRGDVRSASCPVCDLSLDQAAIVLTDIPFTIDLGEDEATTEEHEGWHDARHTEDGDRWAGFSPTPEDFDDEHNGRR